MDKIKSFDKTKEICLVTCPYCGSMFEKKFRAREDKENKGTYSVYMECPHCYKDLAVYFERDKEELKCPNSWV